MHLPETSLEEPNCPLCSAPNSGKPVFRWRNQPYRVVRCGQCKLFFLSPRPTETAMLDLYRRDNYYAGDRQGGYDDYAAQEEALRRTFRRLLKTLNQRGVHGRSLLEIGCGYGYLLAEAAPYFPERCGTDFSEAAVEKAKHFAQRIVQGGPSDLEPTERADVVISNHVIEHVYNPVTFLQELADRLNPGGHLIISTPDMGAFWRHIMGRRWPSFKLPEHVLYFDKNTLLHCIREAGLKPVSTIPYPHAFPLPLVAAKLGLRIPRQLAGKSLWLPRTTLAIHAMHR